MATDLTAESTGTSKPATVSSGQASPSTAWLWWKETRQLAPLVALLAAVSLLLVLLNLFTGLVIRNHGFQISGSVALLVFPALLATGAGPILVGQERAVGTMNWLALLPISPQRLAMTKFVVAAACLAAMWGFALAIISIFDLAGIGGASPWTIGERNGYSGTVYSYPFWICHSYFVLAAGFFVSWRIKNQFYALIALIVLAFLPFVATSITAELYSISRLSDGIEWLNLAFTVLGIVIVTPLGFHAANVALSPSKPPKTKGAADGWLHSPTKSSDDAIAPRFGSQWTPIAWQTIHSSKGTLTILTVMLAIGFFSSLRLASIDRLGALDRWLQFLVLAAPLAISWLGVGVFKHDGSAERIRFLADRGVSPSKTYFALHAVPLAILSTALLLYGLWNLTIAHLSQESAFAAGLPTLVAMAMYALMIYGVSQWTSQLFRTLMLSVIFAPILSIVLIAWLVFAYVGCGFPVYGLIICGLLPFLATFLMMNRYMDSRDRPRGIILSGIVLSVILLWPVGHAAAYIMSIPSIEGQQREQLFSEARKLETASPKPIEVNLSGFVRVYSPRNSFNRDAVEELDQHLQQYTLNPMQVVVELEAIEPEKRAASGYLYDYVHWHGGFSQARIAWRQSPDEQTWKPLAEWLRASAILLPALRNGNRIEDQEVADRLEVLLINAIDETNRAGLADDPDVRAAIASLGTSAQRADARRRAVLVTWLNTFRHTDVRRNYLRVDRSQYDPEGLTGWTTPRWEDAYILTLLEGVESVRSGADDIGWRRKLHNLCQYQGVFETSRYGDAMRSRPAIETMELGHLTGNGHLWGRAWESVKFPVSAGTTDEEGSINE